jgi:hypothetical protein
MYLPALKDKRQIVHALTDVLPWKCSWIRPASLVQTPPFHDVKGLSGRSRKAEQSLFEDIVDLSSKFPGL